MSIFMCYFLGQSFFGTHCTDNCKQHHSENLVTLDVPQFILGVLNG